MDRGINPHWYFVCVLPSNFLVHVEEVAIFFADLCFAHTANGIGEVEIDTLAAWADAAEFIANFLCGTRGNVARHEIAETWVTPLEVIIALVLGDLARGARVTFFLGDPHAAVIAQ